MRHRTGDKVRIGFLCALSCLGLIGIFSHRAVEEVVRTQELVSHTYQVREEVEGIHSALIDGETSTRGYMLTGEERFLDPYQAAVPTIPGRLASLARDVTPTPFLKANTRALTQAARRKVAHMAQSIALKRAGEMKSDSLLQIKRVSEGKVLMDIARRVMAEIQVEEARLLRERQRSASAAVERARQTVLLSCACAPLLLLCILLFIEHDLRGRGRMERTLQEREATLRGFYESGTAMMGVVELRDLPEGEKDIFYISGNTATARFLGLRPEQIPNKYARDLGIPKSRVRQWVRFFKKAEESTQPLSFEVEWEGEDGGLKWLSATMCVIGAGQVGQTRFAYVVQDATDRKLLEAQLREYNKILRLRERELETANARLGSLALYDGLTEVLNRRGFQERLAGEIARARRHNTPLSLLLLDVDHFKGYNDTFGHPAGDAILQRVAALLSGVARVSDVVGRYGGEEFAFLLPETSAEGAEVFAERVRALIADHPWSERSVTVSIGSATLAPGTEGEKTLIAEADKALYHAKKTGRNKVAHFQDLAVHPKRL